jgi:hypothetical protein
MKLTQQRLIEIINEEIEALSAPQITQTTDDIINTLGSLYDSLIEELDSIEDELLEGSDTPNKAMQWLWWGPKVRNAQSKVNKVKLNIVALEFARDNEEHSGAKEKLKAKVIATKEHVKELQSMVDDKFSGKGDITKRSQASEKIKGQLGVIKKTTGMTNNPAKNKELKDQMRELSLRYKREEEAINSLEPSTEERKEAAKALKDKKAAAKKAKADKNKSTKESKLTDGFEDILNESKYQSQSIRDKFNRLL